MIDYQGLMELAQQKAKEKIELLYPKGDARQEKNEQELKNEYYRQYITPPYHAC